MAASRILAPIFSGPTPAVARRPAACSASMTLTAYSLDCSLMLSTVTCTGASHSGNAPAKCSVSTPMNRSMEPKGARWIITGRCGLLSGPV